MKKTNNNKNNDDIYLEYECKQFYFNNGNAGNIISDYKKNIHKVYIKRLHWDKVNIYLGFYNDYMIGVDVLLCRLMDMEASKKEKCFCAKK